MSSKIIDFLPHFHEQFRKRRSEKNIFIRTITEKTKVMEEIKKLDKKELRETRFNDAILKESEILQYVLNDALVVIRANKKEQLGIYIEDKNFAQMYKNLFEIAWAISEK